MNGDATREPVLDDIVLDEHGSPIHLSPERWIIGFVPGLKPQWWHRLAHPTHKHVFGLKTTDGVHWTLFEPWWTRIMVSTVSAEKAVKFLHWAARGDALSVKEEIPGRASQVRLWMNCAALMSFLLGRPYRVWTPNGLFRRLSAEVDTVPLDVNEIIRDLPRKSQAADVTRIDGRDVAESSTLAPGVAREETDLAMLSA